MSKKKKKPPSKSQQPGKRPKPKDKESHSLPKRERKQLEILYEAKEWESIMQQFVLLKESYPKAPELYAMMSYVAEEIRDATLLYHAAYHWQRYAPQHPEALALWAYITLEQMHPGHAMRSLQTLCQLWPDHEQVPWALEQLNALSQIWDEVLDEVGLAGRNDALQLMCYHEDTQIALQEERFGEALSLSKQMISRMPDFIAAYNAAALAQFSLGRVNEAIQLSLQVIEELDDTNIHAIANLIHFLLLEGRLEEAEVHAYNLRKFDLTTSKRDDHFVKIAEGLSYIGDHHGVLDCFAQAEAHVSAQESQLEELPHASLLCHLAAVAAAHTGDSEKAKELWKQALAIEPELKIADDNQAEQHKPQHQRYAPWPFELYNWLPIEILKESGPLYTALIKTEEDNPKLSSLAPIATQIFEKFSFLEQSFPYLLGRCGPQGQELIRLLMLASAQPIQSQQLAVFAQSERGPDQERIDLVGILAALGHFPRGQSVQVWVKGRPMQQLLLGYELDLTAPELPAEIIESIESIQETLAAKDLHRAKQQVQSLLLAHGDEPTVLGLVISIALAQKDYEACRQNCQTLLALCPEEPWALCALANVHMSHGEYAAAKQTLQPVLAMPQLKAHVLLALCELEIELCLQDKQVADARQWFALAKQRLPDAPAIASMKKRFGLFARTRRWFRRK